MKYLMLPLILLLTSGTAKSPKIQQTIPAPGHDRKEVAVFIYHRFGDDRYPSTNVSLADFEAHLNYLKSSGFQVLSFSQAAEYIQDSSRPYRAKVACITIDDAFKSFFNGGYPLLKKYGFTASLFVNSETIGGGSFMTWEEVKKVADGGIEIGNHTHSHDYFLDLPAAQRHRQFREEVLECQNDIKAYVGLVPKVFAYPFGEFDSEMKSIVKTLGFKAAAAQYSGVMYDNDLFAVPRFPMTGSSASINSFREKANMHALRIEKKVPDTPFLEGNNPPSLTLVVDTADADLSRLNCFVPGGCTSEVVGNTVKIIAKSPVTARRTNYTVTAPAKTGAGWYWHTHQWVLPNVKE